jgi:hypothetical protein
MSDDVIDDEIEKAAKKFAKYNPHKIEKFKYKIASEEDANRMLRIKGIPPMDDFYKWRDELQKWSVERESAWYEKIIGWFYFDIVYANLNLKNLFFIMSNMDKLSRFFNSEIVKKIIEAIDKIGEYLDKKNL